MRMSALEWALFAAIVVTTLVWMDVLSVGLLRQVVIVMLAWSLGSTLLVGAFGACMALSRRDHADPHHHLRG